jgi:predicted phage terminase large subunit-like protein
MDTHLLNAILRQDLYAFIEKTFNRLNAGQIFFPNWHLEVLADYLEMCMRGDIKRLIVTLPPRSLKSISASVAFPAWVLGHDPTRDIICVSYAQDLAAKHARDCRQVMQSRWYQGAFPSTRLNARKLREDDFETTKGGGRLSTSTGGALTGRGGDIIIIDDPLKPQDALSETKRVNANQWFDSTLYSRLDTKTESAIIIVMQRLHVDDLVAHVQENEGYTVLNLPAIAEEPERFDLGNGRTCTREVGEALHPKREPLEALDVIRANLGSFFFSAQYQQQPVPVDGNMIQWDWFRRYQDLPPRKPGDQIVMSCDTASKPGELNDYSVMTVWYVQGQDFYLIDVVRERLIYPDLKKKIVEVRKQHAANVVIIEDRSSGTQLIQEFRRHGPFRPIVFDPKEDKVTRMSAQSAKIEGRQVLLPENAPFLADFKTEILQFPNGRHDDQVDSLSQFLAWTDRRGHGIRMLKVRGF